MGAIIEFESTPRMRVEAYISRSGVPVNYLYKYNIITHEYEYRGVISKDTLEDFFKNYNYSFKEETQWP